MRSPISRRAALSGLVALAGAPLAGCASMRDLPMFGSLFENWSRDGEGPVRTPDYEKVYAAIDGEAHAVPRFDYTVMDPVFLRANVPYKGVEPAGTIVVEPARHFLYFVEGGGRATRYGVGVGREGFGWSGPAQVNMRRAWPDWIPPAEMMARNPDDWARLTQTPRGRGVPGGSDNPLGARALYLFANGRDTGYRIHGTPEPETIGQDVSSGCVRMINQDVIHLYGRSARSSNVVVLP